MQVLPTNNTGNSPAFNAKLNINSITKNLRFNNVEQKAIVDAFERGTKNIPGELSVAHYTQNVGAPHYRFTYKNDSHEDMLSCYIVNDIAKTIPEFTSKLQKILSIFIKRETMIKEILDLNAQMTTDSLNATNEIFIPHLPYFKNLKI